MALAPCHECGNEISDKADICPKCGAKPPEEKGVGPIAVVVLVAIALLLIVIFGRNDPQSAEKSRMRGAIDKCMEPVNDELLPREVRLLARGACEKMKDDFRAKFGVSP